MDRNTTMSMLDDAIAHCTKAKEALHKDNKDSYQVNVVKSRGFIQCVFEDLKKYDENLRAAPMLEQPLQVPTDH